MGPAVTDPANGSTRYGVVTCGKQAPGPFDFGPCRLDPGHEPAPCRFAFANGYVSLSSEPYDSDNDPVVQRYHRQLRRSARIAFICVLLSIAALAYNVVQIITR